MDNIEMNLAEKVCEAVWTGIGLAHDGQAEGPCECCNEISVYIKCREVIEWLHNWWPLE
jgi:hypothetical protein